MNTATNDNKPKGKAFDGKNGVNPFRLQKPDIAIREDRGTTHKRVYVKSQRRIDEFYQRDRDDAENIINGNHHNYAVQFLTFWELAGRLPLRAAQLERGGGFNPEMHNLMKMSAEDQYFKIKAFMQPVEWDIVYLVCVFDYALIDIAGYIHKRESRIKKIVQDAFDSLGDALVQMRDFKDDIETGKKHALQAGVENV